MHAFSKKEKELFKSNSKWKNSVVWMVWQQLVLKYILGVAFQFPPFLCVLYTSYFFTPFSIIQKEMS